MSARVGSLPRVGLSPRARRQLSPAMAAGLVHRSISARGGSWKAAPTVDEPIDPSPRAEGTVGAVPRARGSKDLSPRARREH